MRKMDYSVSDEGDLLKLKWIGRESRHTIRKLFNLQFLNLMVGIQQ